MTWIFLTGTEDSLVQFLPCFRYPVKQRWTIWLYLKLVFCSSSPLMSVPLACPITTTGADCKARLSCIKCLSSLDLHNALTHSVSKSFCPRENSGVPWLGISVLGWRWFCGPRCCLGQQFLCITESPSQALRLHFCRGIWPNKRKAHSHFTVITFLGSIWCIFNDAMHTCC
jgi:hypothetical protein